MPKAAKKKKFVPKAVSDEEVLEAAIKIQALARGHIARRLSSILMEKRAGKAPASPSRPVRVLSPQKVAPQKNRAELSKQRHAEKTKDDHTDHIQIRDQHHNIMNRIKGVPRNLDSESRLWEAIEKLSDLSVMQMSQIDLLTKGQGRFKHKNDSKEAKLIEENMLNLKRREAAELTTRKQEFEALIDSHSATMQGVRTSLLEEQTAHTETADMLQDEQLQRKHASDNYKEVQSWLEDTKKRIKELTDEVHGHELAKAALDDNTQDMQTTIGNLQDGITAREERIKVEELKCARVQEELDNTGAVIQKKDGDNSRLQDEIGANSTENQAEQSRLYSEIAHLKTEIDVIMENTKRWENFEKLCPDHKELVTQLETKDEIIHRVKQVCVYIFIYSYFA